MPGGQPAARVARAAAVVAAPHARDLARLHRRERDRPVHRVRLEVAAGLEAERPAQLVLGNRAVRPGHELRVALTDVRAQDVLAAQVARAHVREVRHVAPHVQLQLLAHAAELAVTREVGADEEGGGAAACDGDEATGLQRRVGAPGGGDEQRDGDEEHGLAQRRARSRAAAREEEPDGAQDGGEDEQVGAHEQRHAERRARERDAPRLRSAPRREQRQRRERERQRSERFADEVAGRADQRRVGRDGAGGEQSREAVPRGPRRAGRRRG